MGFSGGFEQGKLETALPELDPLITSKFHDGQSQTRGEAHANACNRPKVHTDLAIRPLDILVVDCRLFFFLPNWQSHRRSQFSIGPESRRRRGDHRQS